jgi:hypothetical protein
MQERALDSIQILNRNRIRDRRFFALRQLAEPGSTKKINKFRDLYLIHINKYYIFAATILKTG